MPKPRDTSKKLFPGGTNCISSVSHIQNYNTFARHIKQMKKSAKWKTKLIYLAAVKLLYFGAVVKLIIFTFPIL